MQLTQFIWCLFLSIVMPFTASLPMHSDIISALKGGAQRHMNEEVKSSKTEGPLENINKQGDLHLPDNPFENNDVNAMPDFPIRQQKMFGFYGFMPAIIPAIPAYYPTLPSEYFTDYYNYNNVGYNEEPEDDEMMSRANNKKRPNAGGNHFKNSPIYYIRLPPTPYMFVPGLGYISQPPTYQPMTPIVPPVVPAVPAMAPMPSSPFYNVPVNFLANGKPTNVYQWGAPSPMPNNQFGGMPSYPPNRPKPYRPYARPPTPYAQDSKVTHLKGPFLFNGRPEDIYLLPNIQNPYNSAYYSDPYSYNSYNQYNGYY